MPNAFFQFKQFLIRQEKSGMKVTTDGCLFGAWVAHQLSEMKEPLNVLDIGTGTGLLALMIAQVTHTSLIDAIEINNSVYEEARQNISASPWKDRVKSFRASLQEFKTDRLYDVIICNPPFFGKNPIGRQSHKNQAIHNDSLPMEDLSAGISRLLSADGSAYILYPEWEMKAFLKWMDKSGLLPETLINVRNKVNTPVFRSMGQFRKNGKTKNEEITIREEDGNYSPEFQRLLDPFYL